MQFYTCLRVYKQLYEYTWALLQFENNMFFDAKQVSKTLNIKNQKFYQGPQLRPPKKFIYCFKCKINIQNRLKTLKIANPITFKLNSILCLKWLGEKVI